ncbi:MAG: gfo/Idh/MocA family oxidoreductase [Rhodocyclales bacterium]|nr:gfo/Idh/MocA family oxidoreductase [Rhodocyclales bacterium]
MLSVCIIGGSGIYGYVLNGLDQRTILRGVAAGSDGEDMTKIHTELARRGLDVPHFDDWQKMLDSIKPDIVAVHCHYAEHARISLACLQRGIHVFSEKPIAASFDELAALRAAYAAGSSKFCTNFSSRYKPWFRALEAALRANRIGEVRLIQAQKSYLLGSRPDFYRSRASYGGTIPWLGSHTMDWIPWLSRQRYESVFATHSTQHNAGYGELEATAQCQFILSNGLSASVSIDFLHPQTVRIVYDDRIRVLGTHGSLETRDEEAWLLNAESKERQRLPLHEEQSIFKDFVGDITGEGVCDVQASDAFVATEACLKARQSADEHRVIYFDEPPAKP